MIHIDQPQEQAINTTEETSQVETPTTETTTTEGSTEPTVETSTDQPVETQVTAQPEVKPTRAQKRIQQLLEERREERQQAAQSQFNPAFSNPFFQQPFAPQVQPGQEITPDQYKADVTRTASDLTQLQINKLRQDLATERTFEKTISEVERTYPILNPDSNEYSEAVSQKITDLYDKASGGRMNPKLLKDIVEGVMSLQTQARTEGQVAVTNQLVRQQAEAAISPTGSQTTVSDFDTAMKIKDPRARLKALEKILPTA